MTTRFLSYQPRCLSRWTSQPGLTAVPRPFSLSGADTLKLDIPAENILIMGGAATYRIKIEKKPQDIVLQTNATTGFRIRIRFLKDPWVWRRTLLFFHYSVFQHTRRLHSHWPVKQRWRYCRSWSSIRSSSQPRSTGSCPGTVIPNQGGGSAIIFCRSGSSCPSQWGSGSSSFNTADPDPVKKIGINYLMKSWNRKKGSSKVITHGVCRLLQNIFYNKITNSTIFPCIFQFSLKSSPPGSGGSAYWIRVWIQEGKWMQIQIRIHSPAVNNWNQIRNFCPIRIRFQG